MYYIIEIQETTGTTPAILTHTQDTKNKAMSVFHTILGSAALSEVEYHTCVVMDEHGQYLARECFVHPQTTPEPEPEPEPEVTEGE